MSYTGSCVMRAYIWHIDDEDFFKPLIWAQLSGKQYLKIMMGIYPITSKLAHVQLQIDLDTFFTHFLPVVC